jgi:hypothetical protein
MKLPVIVWLCALLPVSLFGAWKLGPGQLSLQATFGAMYDDNLLRYSDLNRSKFKDGTEANKSPIRSLDDLRTDYKLTAEWRAKLFQNRRTSLRAVGNFAHHMMNPIKNMGWLSLSANQELSELSRLYLNYFLEPRFYIRDYNDIHTGLPERCEFTLYQTRGDLYYRPLKAVEVAAWSRLKLYRYNEFFTEYDGDLLEIGGVAILRYGDWRSTFEYGFGRFDNTGFEASVSALPPGSLINDSEFGEGDYEEDSFIIKVRRTIDHPRGDIAIEAAVDYASRAFVTRRDVFLDPMHSERKDNILSYELSCSIDLTKRVGFELGGSHSYRHSTAAKPNISEVKDFSRSTFWTTLTYEIE